MSITDLIPGFTWVKFAVVALALVGAGSAGAYAGYRWEHSAVLSIELADAQARGKALVIAAENQKAQDTVDMSAALAEAAAQTKIVTQTVTITKEIPRYVTVHQDAIVCVPVGLARIMRASSAGADPAAIELAPGQSDDACSDLTATEVAGWFSDFAGASRANSEQLTALEAWIIANHAAQESVK